jgi:hypothetical protein
MRGDSGFLHRPEADCTCCPPAPGEPKPLARPLGVRLDGNGGPGIGDSGSTILLSLSIRADRSLVEQLRTQLLNLDLDHARD